MEQLSNHLISLSSSNQGVEVRTKKNVRAAAVLSLLRAKSHKYFSSCPKGGHNKGVNDLYVVLLLF